MREQSEDQERRREDQERRHDEGVEKDWSAAAYMLERPLAVPESEGVLRVCERMAHARLDHVLVVADSWKPASDLELPPEPLGIFTERDLIHALVQHQGGVLEMRVGDLITGPVVTVAPQDDIMDAAYLMGLTGMRRLPVVLEGRTMGLLTHDRVMEAQGQRLSEMARQNLALQRRVTHDPLTGLANRVLFDHVLARELADAGEARPTVSVLALDVDHFKRINDTYGHPTGDVVLRQLAKLLRNTLRRADLAARIGGEEFAVVLSRVGDSTAVVAEKLRAAVEQGSFGEADKPLGITISIGCASTRTSDPPEELFKRADKALYEAKNAGRNRVVSAA